jgi:hypothetical protein
MPKQLTAQQTQAKKDKAVRFADNVLDDPAKADDIEDEDLESWAERHRIQIINSRRRNRNMPDTRTRQDLLDQISDLQDENDALQDQLDAISDVLSGDGDDDDSDDDDNAR